MAPGALPALQIPLFIVQGIIYILPFSHGFLTLVHQNKRHSACAHRGIGTTTAARERELKSPVKEKHQNPIKSLVERFYCHSPNWTC